MARPSYLARRDGGRYFLQIRLGKAAAGLYGKPILRASLRTSIFSEARKRLVGNLGWATEVIAAPDLDTLGAVIHGRLKGYTSAGSPASERDLVERTAFEHQVRTYMARANERGYAFARRFDFFASDWVDFVNENNSAERRLTSLDRRGHYEQGSTDAISAASRSLITVSPPIFPVPTQSLFPSTIVLSHEVHQKIDEIVRDQIAKVTSQILVAAPAGPQSSVSALGVAADTAAREIRFSTALSDFLEPPISKKRKVKGRQEARGIIQFAIDFLEDPLLNSITPDDWRRLDEALPDIPHPRGIPEEFGGSLFRRYQFALSDKWETATRNSVTTIKSGYHLGLNKFIDWAIKEKLYLGDKPKFECIDENNMAPMPRDAFDDNELIKLISLPLFTGCKNAHHIWKQGKYFVQNYLYWGYLILILTGMRPGEVGQLKCTDIMTDGENYFFDLRPFNARNGRVAMKDLRNLKSNAAGRVIPIHPLLIDLGLANRAVALLEAGEQQLFPDWKPYTRKDGTIRWGQPMTKSWQYVKVVLGLTRADLTLYGTRHLMADWLDSEGIAQRTRDRILGHVGGVPGRYGRKGMQDQRQIAAIEALEPPVIKEMRKVLMAAKESADQGGLIIFNCR